MADVREQVATYRQRGWYCMPLRPRSKSPVSNDWPNVRIESDDVKTHFSAKDNVGLILGEPSGWLVDVDLDCDEAIELADSYLPPTPAITGRPSAARSHRWYIAVGATTEKHTDPNDGSMIVELRSTGTQTVVGPSIHPDGETYDTLDSDPAPFPAPMLAACVKALADAVTHQRGTASPPKQTAVLPPQLTRVGNDVESRAIAYINAMPPAIAGSGGHSQTYAAATALVHGFALDPATSLAILPERLFNVPGFVRRVMDFTLANAPYPNIGLAFCGAMALQSFLAGRKVCTSGDLRTNLYLLALASKGTGKEFPRKVNSQILFQIGMSGSLGDKFASGECIQDALVRTGRMLFQNDEMDGVLRQINLDRENSRESIPNILLTLYTSAGDVYPIRVKANDRLKGNVGMAKQLFKRLDADSDGVLTVEEFSQLRKSQNARTPMPPAATEQETMKAASSFATSLNVGLRVECRRSKTKEGASNDEYD